MASGKIKWVFEMKFLFLVFPGAKVRQAEMKVKVSIMKIDIRDCSLICNVFICCNTCLSQMYRIQYR